MSPHLVYHRSAVPVSPQSLPDYVGVLVAGVPLYAFSLRTQCGHVVLQHQGAISSHVRVVAAYLSDEIIMTMDRETLQDTIIEIVVFGSLVRVIKPPHSPQPPSPIHHRRYVDGATAQQF